MSDTSEMSEMSGTSGTSGMGGIGDTGGVGVGAGDVRQAPVDAVIARVRQVYRGWNRSTSVARMRADWDALFGAATADDAVRSNRSEAVEAVSAGGVDAVWISTATSDPGKVVLYLHGGGFQVGSTRSHRSLMASVATESGCRVLGLDYRLAPEHRHPAALQDALAAHDWLLAQGIGHGDIAFAGDSAGAGLALLALLSLRDAARPLPAAAVLMSAWTDLSASGASYESRAASDPIHQRAMVLAMGRAYLGTEPAVDARSAAVSPLFADLRGLPPLLLQVGDRETVLSDSTALADAARAAGVEVDLRVWPDMIHVFQQFPEVLVEARAALRDVGAFLRSHLRPSVASPAASHPT